MSPKGLKQADIEKCVSCGEGMMHDNQLTFFTMTIARFVVNVRAIERQHGLEMFMGGGNAGAAIAHIMGPQEDLAMAVHEPVGVWICQGCAIRENLFDLWQAALEKKQPSFNEGGNGS